MAIDGELHHAKRPALVSLFTFLANWRAFLAPLIFLQTNDLYMLALGLQ
jgi:ABC-type glycerol-3-phosphate transport system permease component